MRVLHAAALTTAALFLASITSAQGLGDAAAREKEKRNATPAKPARVYTDHEVAATPTSPSPDAAPEATPAGEGADTTAGGGEPGAGAGAPARRRARPTR